MSGVSDALVHLDDALDALTIEAYRDSEASDSMTRMPPIEATLAVDLERMDRALGHPVFASLAEEIKRAVISIVAAQNALKGKSLHYVSPKTPPNT